MGDSSLAALKGEDQVAAPTATPSDKKKREKKLRFTLLDVAFIALTRVWECVCTAQISSSTPTVFTVHAGFK